MPPVGAEVVVLSLGKKRGVVIATGRSRYHVRVEGITMWCREDELASVPEARKTSDVRQKPPRPGLVDDAPDAIAPASRIDLHGLRVEEALARVIDEIDHALRRGSARIEVVHGKGSGRIKHALYRQLSTMPIVKAYRLDPHNSGVTWIQL